MRARALRVLSPRRHGRRMSGAISTPIAGIIKKKRETRKSLRSKWKKGILIKIFHQSSCAFMWIIALHFVHRFVCTSASLANEKFMSREAYFVILQSQISMPTVTKKKKTASRWISGQVCEWQCLLKESSWSFIVSISAIGSNKCAPRFVKSFRRHDWSETNAKSTCHS